VVGMDEDKWPRKHGIINLHANSKKKNKETLERGF
jgi:hypothetical protein